jgi:hypothetical protein
MPGLLPIILTSSYLVLAADKVPELNIDPTCRAAASTNVRASSNQDGSACKRDEQDAHNKLEQGWDQFSANDRAHCVRTAALGGSPSYVELLTCLELSKQADALPSEIHNTGQGSGAVKP